MLLAVPNFSEGRDASVIAAIDAALEAEATVLDVHSDATHHRGACSRSRRRRCAPECARSGRAGGGRVDQRARRGWRPPVRRGARRVSARVRGSGRARGRAARGARGRRGDCRALGARLPVRRARDNRGAARARPLPPWWHRRAHPPDACGRACPRLRPGRAPPDRGRDARHRPLPACRFQRRPRHLGHGGRPGRRGGAARVGRRARGRSRAGDRAPPANESRSRPTSTTSQLSRCASWSRRSAASPPPTAPRPSRPSSSG